MCLAAPAPGAIPGSSSACETDDEPAAFVTAAATCRSGSRTGRGRRSIIGVLGLFLDVGAVPLKFFCGYSFAEIAGMNGLSERTVQRHWEKARLYLHDAIG
jgi:hypothetical protein